MNLILGRFFLIFFFTVLSFFYSHGQCDKDDVLCLKFNEAGQMKSISKNRINGSVKKLKITVEHSEKYLRQSIKSVFTRYYNTLKNTHKDSQLPYVNSELYNELIKLSNEYSEVFNDGQSATKIEKLAGFCDEGCRSLSPNSNHYAPKTASLYSPNYEFIIKYFSGTGKFLKEQKDIIACEDFASAPLATGSTCTYTMDLVIPGECKTINFELRRKNNIYDHILKYALHNCVPKEKSRFETFIETSTDIEIFVLKRDQILTIGTDINEKKYPSLYYKWVNEGLNWEKPFVYEPKTNSSKEKKSKYESEIVDIDFKLDHLKSRTGNSINEIDSIYTELIKMKRAAADSVKDASTAIKKAANFKNVTLKDSLLYKGKLVYSGKGEYRYMRHHDAALAYTLMSEKPRVEITTEEEIQILSHNENGNAGSELFITPEKVTNDNPVLSDQVASFLSLSDKIELPEIPPIVPTHDKILAEVLPPNNKSSNLLGTVAASTAILLDNIGSVCEKIDYQLPDQIIDKSENYKTIYFRHAPLESMAPLKVKYEIKNKGGQKSLSGKYFYRYNKLQNWRLKPGIVYSWLTNTKYTLNSEKTAVENVTRNDFGIATSIGVQLFPYKQDIRRLGLNLYSSNDKYKRKFSWPIYFYGGIMLRDKPWRQFLLGGGIEPVYGFAITAGKHIGEVDQLQVNEFGTLSTDKVWRQNWFVSVNIDYVVFERLIKLLGINNPFK
ncbi:MAG: hypothetical protein AAFZ15_32755 [Bacteroidota bacterium]